MLKPAVLVATITLVALAACSRAPGRDDATVALEPCRLKGVEIELRCGAIEVAEDRDRPAAPGSRRIRIRFAVVPALARKAEPDAIFVLAGGPGQAATEVAGQVVTLFTKLNRDRDLVLVDQRGTGGSHRLSCRAETEARGESGSFGASLDDDDLPKRIAACAARLSRDADLTRYTTTIAMQDLDEVRARLGYRQVDLWGASYGTRAALEYLRLFPDRVRTMTLDGVAPPSQKLPLSFGVDTWAAVGALVDACDRDSACAAKHPKLRTDLDAMLARIAANPAAKPSVITVGHPLTGARESVPLNLAGLATLLRTPLYTSLTASLLPDAIDRATRGDFDALAATGFAIGNGIDEGIALGMHLSVVCSEDVLAIDAADRAAARAEALHSVVDGRPNPFATVYLAQYDAMCAKWPSRAPPPAYFVSLAESPGAAVPTLLLSGGIDPATPPARAEALAKTLTRARHVVAPNVGHGVSMQGCAPDLIDRFVRTADEKAPDATCLAAIPRPLFLQRVVEAPRAAGAPPP